MADLSRRKLIGSLISLVAAPAIVRVSSIMPVKTMESDIYAGFDLASGEDRTLIRVVWNGYEWWCDGKSSVLHYREIANQKVLVRG